MSGKQDKHIRKEVRKIKEHVQIAVTHEVIAGFKKMVFRKRIVFALDVVFSPVWVRVKYRIADLILAVRDFFWKISSKS